MFGCVYVLILDNALCSEGLSARQGANADEIQLRIDPVHGDLDEEISGLHSQVKRLKSVRFQFFRSSEIIFSSLFAICCFRKLNGAHVLSYLPPKENLCNLSRV